MEEGLQRGARGSLFEAGFHVMIGLTEVSTAKEHYDF